MGRGHLTDAQLEIIHEYIEERANHRITWIIIWLIVIACMVEAVSRPGSMTMRSLGKLYEGRALM